jgi:Ni/Fe-hydrogenase subunit HybB-like protein
MNAEVVQKKPHLSRFHLWLIFLAGLMVLGVIAGFFVMTRGLIVTNLNDLVPWGLWITVDLSSIAMSAGAFLLCAAVYLLGLKKYQPVARTATYVGLIGYSMAVLCLMLDIGRPDRFWHALVYWNPHSLLWEVTMCVTLYLSVLSLETIPIIGSANFMQVRWPRLSLRMQGVHKLAPLLAIAGLGLSMLHQSSLGAVYGILKAKPIWYSPGLSVLFMVSAIVGGTSLTVLASMSASRLSSRAKVNDELLDGVSRFIAWALVGYLYFRFWDALSVTYTYVPGRNEGLEMLTRNNLSFNFWVGEILLGAIVPLIILHTTRLRQAPLLRMLALMLVVGGIVAYRWDTNMVGQLVVLSYLPQETTARFTQYFPSLIEFMAAAGIVAYGLMVFTLGVRYLNVVNHYTGGHTESEEQEEIAGLPAVSPATGD